MLRFSVLSRYLIKRFAFWYLWVTLGVFGLVVVATLIDIIRRFGGDPAFGLSTMVELAVLRAPLPFFQAGPFVAILASAAAFHRLSRDLEMGAMASLGLSRMSLLIPVGGWSMIVACVFLVVVQPVGVGFWSLAKRLEAQVTGKQPVAKDFRLQEGFWFRSVSGDQELLVYARGVQDAGRELENVTVFVRDEHLHAVERIDARRARLEDGNLLFIDNVESDLEGRISTSDLRVFPSDFQPEHIRERAIDPDLVVIWAFPERIAKLRLAGFPSHLYEQAFFELLIHPFKFLLMAIVASMTMVEGGRRQHPTLRFLLALGLAVFAILFPQLVVTLSLAAGVPPSVSTIASALFLLSLAFAFHHRLEEG